MFIMTFVAKPRSRAESRQIVQGITFSLRWDMWGHTWQDLLHADTEMTQPWATLRALGLYKKPNAVWGVDYVTSSCERIAKEDFGFFREHLDDFISFGGFRFIPPWLQGEVGEDESWPEFLLDTLERCEAFMRGVSFQFAVFYVVFFFTFSMMMGGPSMKGRVSRFVWALIRLSAIYGTVLALYNVGIEHVDESDWAYDIRNGLKYTSPFGNEESAYFGPSTFPHRNDVLIETRYKSKYLALYNDYIGNHPGNRLWNQLLDEKAEIYASYEGFPFLFREAVAKFIVSVIRLEEGRFLYQSPDAHWVEIKDDDAEIETEFQLAVKSNTVKKKVVQALEFLISEVKYDHRRKSAMSKGMLPYLLNLKTRLAYSAPSMKEKVAAVRKAVNEFTNSSNHHHFHSSGSTLSMPERKRKPFRRPADLHVGELPEEPELGAWLRAGDVVNVWFNERGVVYWYKADLLQVLSTGVCIVHFPGDGYDDAVTCKKLIHYVPPKVGDVVEVNSEGNYYQCTIVSENDDGTFDIDVSGEEYEVVSDSIFRRPSR